MIILLPWHLPLPDCSQQMGLVCDTELYSEHLAQAVDAAITSLVSTPGWLLDLKTRNNYTHALDIFTCTPDAEKWDFPPAEKAQGLLKKVLDDGKLRVAGVQVSFQLPRFPA